MLQTVRAPVSHPIKIADLRPTQMTVGLREAEARRERMKEKLKANGEKSLRKNVIPVVQGPKNRYYIIDHHHLCHALLGMDIDEVSVTVVLNLSRLDKQAFWVYLDNTGLVHPFDADGKRCDYKDIPKSVKDMKDDPYRSLAGMLRRMGGFAKDTTPFSEFLWADFLRRRIDKDDVKNDFDVALEKALKLAKSRDADFLPGWCGPLDDSDV